MDVRTFIVTREIITETLSFLRRVGESGCEGFVLWGGRRESADVFRFETSWIPAQRASRTESGLLVFVDGDALFAVNKELFARGQTLGAQIHSHPAAAYHSSLDDMYPLATLTGALSLVVPDFARNAPADVDDWAWYRLQLDGRWLPLDDSTEIVIE